MAGCCPPLLAEHAVGAGMTKPAMQQVRNPLN